MRVATCMKSIMERMFICMVIPCADVTNRLPKIERQFRKDENDFRNVKFRISVYQNLTCGLPESDLRFIRIRLAVYQNLTCRITEYLMANMTSCFGFQLCFKRKSTLLATLGETLEFLSDSQSSESGGM
jgi:hypothetical protein